MNHVRNKKGSILPLTILLIALMLMSMQTVLTVTVQHNWRLHNSLAEEQSRYLAASGWNIVMEQLEKVDLADTEEIFLTIAEVGTINAAWHCFGEEAKVTAIGKVGETSCTYRGVILREPIYPEQKEEEIAEDTEIKPIGYQLSLQERRID